MTRMGTTTLRNRGVLMDMIMMLVKASKAEPMRSLNDMGMMNSMAFMSLLNRFRMRPMGVASKKDILLCIIDVSMLLWKFLDELTTI
jgi:hypothetical protein